MYLKSKQVAFLGLLTAISIVMIVLSGVIEVSTFFFLAFAAFCIGVAIQECGMQAGFSVFAATGLLAILLAPNKIYCITYAALSVYILAIEITIRVQAKKNKDQKKILVIKYIIFNMIYLPILIFLPKLIYHGEFSVWIYLIAIIGGQILFYIFDRVYFECMHYYIKVLRHRFKMD